VRRFQAFPVPNFDFPALRRQRVGLSESERQIATPDVQLCPNLHKRQWGHFRFSLYEKLF
jgi:hypothetical protein